MYDQLDRLVLESDVSAVVMGKGEAFTLYFLNAAVDMAAAKAEVERKDFAYCGVLGVRDGQPSLRIDPTNPDAVYVMCFASLAFIREVAPLLVPRPKSDGLEWLGKLHSLQDPRG